MSALHDALTLDTVALVGIRGGMFNMNAKVEKTINGLSVSAAPVFKGGLLPAYWAGIINEHVLRRTFKSAAEVFRFAKRIKLH